MYDLERKKEAVAENLRGLDQADQITEEMMEEAFENIRELIKKSFLSDIIAWLTSLAEDQGIKSANCLLTILCYTEEFWTLAGDYGVSASEAFPEEAEYWETFIYASMIQEFHETQESVCPQDTQPLIA